MGGGSVLPNSTAHKHFHSATEKKTVQGASGVSRLNLER